MVSHLRVGRLGRCLSAAIVVGLAVLFLTPSPALGSWLSDLSGVIGVGSDIASIIDTGISLLQPSNSTPQQVIVNYNYVQEFQSGSATSSVLQSNTTLADAASEAGGNVVNVANQVGQNVTNASNGSVDGSVAAQWVRDCTKMGLNNTAWDLWWGWTYRQMFNPDEDLEGNISSCLETYAGADSTIADPLASTLVYYIEAGESTALQVNYDVAGLANWLEALNYYYIPY